MRFLSHLFICLLYTPESYKLQEERIPDQVLWGIRQKKYTKLIGEQLVLSAGNVCKNQYREL